MYTKKYYSVFFMILFFGCQPAVDSEFQVNFEKYTLDNGLDVILHIDRSDPIVAIAVTYHVGSAREIEGRTGFAHMFEHLLFQNSENLGEGGLDLLMQKVGGTTPNGSTTRDRTNYIEVFPKDALEKAIWAESDRMGFFINTVMTPNFEREKQIVKNEKRQGVDNNPYGHTNYVIGKNLYPPEHPYSWQVIGSLDDLQRATVEDVKNFYEKWYGPNNATLVIAGDLDIIETKRYVEKYFGEIKARGTITPLSAEPVVLTETKKLYHEDTFARLPRITMTWLTVKQYHQDFYPLNALSQLLSRGKKSPFYKVLVEEMKLTSNVSVRNRGSELSGEFAVSIQGFPGTDLDDIADGINEAFERFETEGVTEQDLSRIKTRQETGFYNSLSSVLSKATTLARFSIFAGDPGYTTEYIDNILSVTIEDVNRVYEQYVKGKHFVATSFVPRGSVNLVLDGSVKAEVVEEAIVTGAEREIEYGEQEEIEITPSAINRSMEPPLSDAPEITVPAIWSGIFLNGMKIFGIEHSEVPLVQFSIRLKGGMLLDDPEKVGVASFTASMMTEGTKNRTPEELEEVIDELGATIRLFASNQAITVSGNTLARNYEKVMELVEEILLEPRWDEKEFDILKQRILNNIRQRSANPGVIASNVFNKLLYGKDHILSNSASGTLSSVESITLDDLKEYYNNYFSPSVAVMHIVGDVDQTRITASLTGLADRWQGSKIVFPEYDLPEGLDKTTVYFVDVPDAKQSVIRTGYLALNRKDPEFYPATVSNYKLGGGFTSRLNQILRERRGYTYGVGAGFAGSDIPGPYQVSTSVRSNVTLESLVIINDQLTNYGSSFTETDLTDTKNFLVKSNARAFETRGALLGMLQNISLYDFPFDYVKQREDIVNNMSLTDIKALANKYITPASMYFLVVGDAKTQLARLEALGYGKPILLDREANRVR